MVGARLMPSIGTAEYAQPNAGRSATSSGMIHIDMALVTVALCVGARDLLVRRKKNVWRKHYRGTLRKKRSEGASERVVSHTRSFKQTYGPMVASQNTSISPSTTRYRNPIATRRQPRRWLTETRIDPNGIPERGLHSLAGDFPGAQKQVPDERHCVKQGLDPAVSEWRRVATEDLYRFPSYG
ncbi:hypothetical protein PENSPDRAFT_668588 [Peniophora sp. CONT]|nr:hypothetical protein PENSPDRAFT_668588 [Peniophora sp. CONT]